MNQPRKTICLYLHIHQPHRLTKLSYLDIGNVEDKFMGPEEYSNSGILKKVALKSYYPTLKILKKIAKAFPEFGFSISITGTILEQIIEHEPKLLKTLQEVIGQGNVEILSETYYHSLASIYSLEEFLEQIKQHRDIVKEYFNFQTKSFRNTELIYSNEIAEIVRLLGFDATIAEGWDKYLGWRSSNYLYTAKKFDLDGKSKSLIREYKFRNRIQKKLPILLKNYKLSDDIAFRFSNREWQEYPLTVEKYQNWIDSAPGEIVNLFMDFETFGEHQWEDSGIFDFLENFLKSAIKNGYKFKTISSAADSLKPKDEVDFPELISWADMERDLSAWNGNKMQQSSLRSVYEIQDKLRIVDSLRISRNQVNKLFSDWRKLQTSDHFYYMSTKYWHDGDVHKYFSPYSSPYEAFINYMNILEDFNQKLDYLIDKRSASAHAKKNRH